MQQACVTQRFSDCFTEGGWNEHNDSEQKGQVNMAEPEGSGGRGGVGPSADEEISPRHNSASPQ